MRRFLLLALILIFTANASALAANENLAVMGRRAGIVGKAAVAGAAGGLVVGLASQAFKKKSKNIFLFGSLGFYAGIAMGLYLVSAPRGSTGYEGPDTYEDFGNDEGSLAPERQRPNVVEDPLNVEVSLVTLDF